MGNQNEYYLSVYHPISDQNRNQIELYIKSFIQEALRNDPKLKKQTRLHNNIIEKILNKLESTVEPHLENGIGIFIKFNSSKQQHGRLDEIDNLVMDIISFPRAPKKEIYIGNVYNLEQLIWMENVFAEALALSFNEKECNMYTIEGNQIERVNSLLNQESQNEDEYNHIYAPQGTMNGNKKDDSLQIFVKDILQSLSSSLDLRKTSVEYFVVFYSSPYASFIEEKITEYISSNGSVTPIFINKNIDNPNEILATVRKKIKELQKTTKKDSLDLAKEEYNEYCEGWLESTKALNMNQVSKLFIKAGAKKSGYLNPKTTLLYTYPKRNTVKVGSIVPWAIKSVIDKGGELVILRGDRYVNAPDVAVQLRYAKRKKNTNNPERIKKWVNARKGVPAIVKGTEDLLRIKFSDDEKDLGEVRWDWFFEKLNKNNLFFVYDDSPDSRFCTFVSKK